MSAYGVKLPPRDCRACQKRAVVEVFNSKNASVGFFCGSHGIVKVKALDEIEEDDRQRTDKGREKP